MAVQIQITPNGNEDQSQVSKERKWDKVLADGSGLITLRYWRLKPLGGGSRFHALVTPSFACSTYLFCLGTSISLFTYLFSLFLTIICLNT